MKPIPAIVEPAQIDLALIEQQITVEIGGVRDDLRMAERYDKQAESARESAKRRRLRIGELLTKARPTWPARGPAPKESRLPAGAPASWAEFLTRLKLDDATARRYMDEYRDPEGFAQKQAKLDPAEGDRPAAIPVDDDEPDEPADVLGQQRETPPFRQLTEDDLIQALGRLDPKARGRVLKSTRANVKGGSGEEDRGTWCTSKEWAVAVGPWDLDPFSNPRSHIASVTRCMLEDGGDAFCEAPPGGGIPGLYLTGNAHGATPTRGKADELTRVWIQPPYELVAEAIAHYGHTRFCALLRWSPDVKAWFPQLWQRTAVVCHPFGERMDFEPPPGVDKSGDMPFPHALYYAHEGDVTDEVRARCLVWRIDHSLDCAQPNPAALQIFR
jgi:hypothetical protein